MSNAEVKPILDTAPEPREDDRPKDDASVKTNIAEEPVYVKNAVGNSHSCSNFY